MATGITGASRLPEPEDFDYSRSHRHVPIPTVAYNATAASAPPVISNLPGRPREKDEAAQGSRTPRHDRSFSFRRAAAAPSSPPTSREGANNPRSGNAFAAAAAQQGTGFSAAHEDDNDRSFSPTKMLRKQSRRASAEKEAAARQEAEAAAAARYANRQAPRLPQHNPLPGIDTFNEGDEPRPDSVAIFNNGYTHTPLPSIPQNQQTSSGAANFSRPGNNMPSSSSYNKSSSPAYALRGAGNAFAQQASSSPSVSGRSSNGEYVDVPVNRSESMANRGRYSVTSAAALSNSVSSPRRIRRRKDPTPFNVLVVGAKNSGKSSFISFLRHSLALPRSAGAAESTPPPQSKSSSFTSHFLESEIEGERIGLTLWDSAGLEKHIIDLQLREVTSFVESKFEETFLEEQKVNRTPGVKDTHIHCVLFILDPVRLDTTVAALEALQKGVVVPGSAGGLSDDMDLQVIRALWGKTTVIPVISKADTLTTAHMAFLKRAVWESLKSAKLDPLEALELEGDDDEEDEDDDNDDQNDRLDEEDEGSSVIDNLVDRSSTDQDTASSDSDNPLPTKPKSKNNSTQHTRQVSTAGSTRASPTDTDDVPYIPMSILSPDPYDLPPSHPSQNSYSGLPLKKIGRTFPWGFADPMDPDHCDFPRLRESIFAEWRSDLRDLARTKWYENWRTSRLNNLPGTRQRVKGGVTPLGSVPREGRTSPRAPKFGGNAVPRSVSQQTNGSSAPIGMAVTSSEGAVGGGVAGAGRSGGGGSTSKAERMMGMNAGEAQSLASIGRAAGGQGGAGMYRTAESYQ